MKCRRLKELKAPFAQDYKAADISGGSGFFPPIAHTQNLMDIRLSIIRREFTIYV